MPRPAKRSPSFWFSHLRTVCISLLSHPSHPLWLRQPYNISFRIHISLHGSPGSIPGPSMWDLWWGSGDEGFLPSISLFPSVTFHKYSTLTPIIFRRCYIILGITTSWNNSRKDKYTSWSSSIYNFLQSPVTSFSVRPKII